MILRYESGLLLSTVRSTTIITNMKYYGAQHDDDDDDTNHRHRSCSRSRSRCSSRSPTTTSSTAVVMIATMIQHERYLMCCRDRTHHTLSGSEIIQTKEVKSVKGEGALGITNTQSRYPEFCVTLHPQQLPGAALVARDVAGDVVIPRTHKVRNSRGQILKNRSRHAKIELEHSIGTFASFKPADEPEIGRTQPRSF